MQCDRGCKTCRKGALAEPEMPNVAANTVHLFELTHASKHASKHASTHGSFSGPNSRYAYWARREKKKKKKKKKNETMADGARGRVSEQCFSSR